jgi:hypothetical protein
VKRTREHISMPYVYYIENKLKNWEHRLKMTDFYVKHVPYIVNWNSEAIIGNLRADCLLDMQIHSGLYLIALEVELVGAANVKKYEELYISGKWQSYLPVFPIVCVIGKFKQSKIIKVVGEDELINEIERQESRFCYR